MLNAVLIIFEEIPEYVHLFHGFVDDNKLKLISSFHNRFINGSGEENTDDIYNFFYDDEGHLVTPEGFVNLNLEESEYPIKLNLYSGSIHIIKTGFIL